MHPEDHLFCENGKWAVGNRVIRDSHPLGLLTFADVIAQSSNICSAKVAERLGRDRFGRALQDFGFGVPTGIDLPGEAAGLLRPVSRWGRIHLVTTAFGQGVAVTPLQLTRAFAAIANGGRLMRPYVVRRITGPDGEVRYAGAPPREGQVVSPQTAASVTNLLVRVTENGTGKEARIDGFSVAGKTGRRRKSIRTPAATRPRPHVVVCRLRARENPALVILVVIDTPRRATYGGVVAAPVSRAVASYGLARRGVLPRGSTGFVPAAPAPEFRTERAITAISSKTEEDEIVPLPIAPGGMPSFVGLGMREALVRAHSEGWEVHVEGSGYVIRQDPQPGASSTDRGVTLTFGSDVS